MIENILSQYTKEEIVNAIENGCNYFTYQRIANYCEIERLKQATKKLSEQQARIEETKRLYMLGWEDVMTKHKEIEELPLIEEVRMIALQQDFLRALKEDSNGKEKN